MSGRVEKTLYSYLHASVTHSSLFRGLFIRRLIMIGQKKKIRTNQTRKSFFPFYFAWLIANQCHGNRVIVFYRISILFKVFQHLTSFQVPRIIYTGLKFFISLHLTYINNTLEVTDCFPVFIDFLPTSSKYELGNHHGSES